MVINPQNRLHTGKNFVTRMKKPIRYKTGNFIKRIKKSLGFGAFCNAILKRFASSKKFSTDQLFPTIKPKSQRHCLKKAKTTDIINMINAVILTDLFNKSCIYCLYSAEYSALAPMA